VPFRKISRLIRPASDYRPNATHSLRYLDTGISVARVQACTVLGPRTSVRFRTNFYNALDKPKSRPVGNSLFRLSPEAVAGRMIDFFIHLDF
jgi:hypothetical protein